MRARSFAVLLCLVAACSGRAPHHVLATSPVPRPDDVLLEVTHGGGDGALAALHDALPVGPLRTGAPTRLADVVASGCAGIPPGVAARARQTPALRVVALRGAGLRAAALAVRVRLDADEHPLGGDVTLDAEDVDGVRTVHFTHATAAAGAVPVVLGAMALRGDVLVCANDAATLHAALPYLTRTLLPAPAPPGLSFLAPDGVAARDLRPWLDDAAASFAHDLRESARSALAAHVEAPPLGSPVALVDALLAHVTALVAYVPDLGVIDGHLDAAPEGLHLVVHADVHPGSPLAGALDDLPTFPRALVGALPTGTAVGLVVGDAHGAVGSHDAEPWSFANALVADLTRLAGPRLAHATRDGALAALVGTFGAARGDASVVSLGHDGHEPFLLVGAHASTTPPASPVILAAAGVPFLASVAGALGGCPSDATPAMNGPETVELCGVHAAWRMARSDGAWAGQIAPVPPLVLDLDHVEPQPAPPPTVASTVASALSGHDADTLRAQPDTARAIASLPSTPLVVVALAPQTLAPALDLFTPDRAARAVPPPQPVLLALSRADAELQLDVVAPPHALAPLVAAVAAALGD